MKIKPVTAHLLIMFFLPLYAAAAQDATAAAQEMIGGLGSTATSLFNKIIAFIAQIGNLFGDVTGIRIGGTTATAVASLVVAKVAEDKLPSWAKTALYVTGGTMFAGSGASIVQVVTNLLGQ